MKNAILLAALSFSSNFALATPKAEIWTGKGNLYGADQSDQGEYDLRVEIGPETDGGTPVKVTVTAGGQIVHTSDCVRQGDGTKWTETCADGSQGGGYLFARGLGQAYTRSPDGKAYATSIVLDDANKMRLVRTELVNGEATRFFSEDLTKQ